jgi:hypothetical protein
LGDRVVHGDYFAGVDNVDVETLLAWIGNAKALQLRADALLLANQDNLYPEIARGLDRAFNLNGGSIVSAHGVNRNGSEHREGS